LDVARRLYLPSSDKAHMADGDRGNVQFKSERIDVKFGWYHYSAEAYERAFKEVGFERFKWVNHDVGEGVDREYYKDLLEHPCQVGYEAYKPE